MRIGLFISNLPCVCAMFISLLASIPSVLFGLRLTCSLFLWYGVTHPQNPSPNSQKLSSVQVFNFLFSLAKQKPETIQGVAEVACVELVGWMGHDSECFMCLVQPSTRGQTTLYLLTLNLYYPMKRTFFSLFTSLRFQGLNPQQFERGG